MSAMFLTIEASYLLFKHLKENPLIDIQKKLKTIQPHQIPASDKKVILSIFKETHRTQEKERLYFMLIGPIIEELIFRGGLQSLIKKAIIYFLPCYIKIAAKIAIVVSGICFGLGHLKQAKFQALHSGIGGCFVLGPLMEKYGLLTSMGAHIINNTLVAGFSVSFKYYNTISIEKISTKLVQNKDVT